MVKSGSSATRHLQHRGLGAILLVEPHQHQHQNRKYHHDQPGALGELREREDRHHTRRQDARRQVDHQLVAPAGPTMGQMVFGHPVAGHRECGEHAHREHRHQRVDPASGGDQERHREHGQQNNGVGEHQPMTALHQWPWQEAVLGDKVSQRRKTVEAGIGTVVQNRCAGGLQQEVHDVADQPATENRAADLGEHRRISGRKRHGMSSEAEPGHTGQQQPQNRSHQGQHPARVRAFRLPKQVDRVGNRLHPGQRRTAVGERPQDHQDRRAHHQAVALLDRHRAVNVVRGRMPADSRALHERRRPRSSA